MYSGRLLEPSTHAGLAVLVQVVKVLAPEWSAVADAASVFFASLAVALREKGRRHES